MKILFFGIWSQIPGLSYKPVNQQLQVNDYNIQ